MEKNYGVKQFGGWNQVEGKIFLGEALGLTGAQLSVQKLAAHEDAPFLHAHKKHEEVYLILSGKGEYQVDGEVFPVAEGTIIRVAPAGVRALRNTSDEPMVMCCIQYKANSFGENDDFMVDGTIINEPVKW